MVSFLQRITFPWRTPYLPLPCASTGLSGCKWPKRPVRSLGMPVVLTAPALMGPPTGTSAPRHPWSFSSLTSHSLSFSLICKSSPTLLVQAPTAMLGRQTGLAQLFWNSSPMCMPWLDLGRSREAPHPKTPKFPGGSPETGFHSSPVHFGLRRKHWRNGNCV